MMFLIKILQCSCYLIKILVSLIGEWYNLMLPNIVSICVYNIFSRHFALIILDVYCSTMQYSFNSTSNSNGYVPVVYAFAECFNEAMISSIIIVHHHVALISCTITGHHHEALISCTIMSHRFLPAVRFISLVIQFLNNMI